MLIRICEWSCFERDIIVCNEKLPQAGQIIKGKDARNAKPLGLVEFEAINDCLRYKGVGTM